MIVVSSLIDTFEESLQVDLKDSSTFSLTLEESTGPTASLKPALDFVFELEDAIAFVVSWGVLDVG